MRSVIKRLSVLAYPTEADALQRALCSDRRIARPSRAAVKLVKRWAAAEAATKALPLTDPVTELADEPVCPPLPPPVPPSEPATEPHPNADTESTAAAIRRTFMAVVLSKGCSSG